MIGVDRVFFACQVSAKGGFYILVFIRAAVGIVKHHSGVNAYLKLGDNDLPPLPISINFFELIRKINQGYRPNRHDKNNIIILEEVIEDITSRIRSTDQLFIQKKDESWTLVNDIDEEEIRVER